MEKEPIYEQMSRPEKEVAILLKKLGIRWSYEQPVFVWDENKRPRVWAPDFYLIPFGIHIEVCGTKKFDYNYRRSIYKNNGYDVIFLHLYKETNKWKKHLMEYLKKILSYRNQEIDFDVP